MARNTGCVLKLNDKVCIEFEDGQPSLMTIRVPFKEIGRLTDHKIVEKYAGAAIKHLETGGFNIKHTRFDEPIMPDPSGMFDRTFTTKLEKI